jgi:protein-disulfide isomerase/uncharacterized membrane protein
MKQTKLATPKFYLLSILSAFGAAVSIWQTHEYFMTRGGMGAFHSFCNIGQTFDCTAVEMSKYSEFIGGYPLAGFAIAGYILILILALMGAGSESFQKTAKPYLVFFSSICVLFSLGYAAIMIAVIGKLCILCLTIDAINIALLVVALKLPSAEPTPEGIRIPHIIGVGVASLFIAFLFARGMDPQAEMKAEDLRDLVDSVINTPSVPVEIPANSPMIGDPNAKVTIVKYSDYECPACKMAATAIHPLFKRYPSGVKFVFVNYPLDQACNPDIPRKMHEFACEAAEVAICGAAQGKFIETYETLFDRQKDFAAGKVADLLSDIPGIDMTKLKECTKLPSTGEKLRSDIAAGGKTKMNIQATPTFFVNGRKLESGLPTNLWITVIDRLLKQ